MTAWWVVCQSPENPDGPAAFAGPISTLERAEFDVWHQERSRLCNNKHYVGRGPESLPDAVAFCTPEQYPDAWAEFQERAL